MSSSLPIRVELFAPKHIRFRSLPVRLKDRPLVNFLELRPGEKVSTIVAARSLDEKRHLMMVTKKGIIKKVALSAFANIRKNGIIALNLAEGDELVGVIRVDGQDRVMLVTSLGQSIMFAEEQVREHG